MGSIPKPEWDESTPEKLVADILRCGTFVEFRKIFYAESTYKLHSAHEVCTRAYNFEREIIAALKYSGREATNLSECFAAVDASEIIVRTHLDLLSVEYGAGENTFGAIFWAGKGTDYYYGKELVKVIDGDLERADETPKALEPR